jgi:6,7-dimethyl-8-ribityllumazine synthase
MTDRDRTGTYNPFEDTGDWPFRESTAPPADGPDEQAKPSVFDREADGPEPELELEPDPDPDPDPPFRLEEERPETLAKLPESVSEALVEVPAPAEAEDEEERLALSGPEPEPGLEAEPEPAELELAELEPAELEPAEGVAGAAEPGRQHAPGDLLIPEGPELLEGAPNGFRRTVAVVVSRFNADVTNQLLENAIEALVDAHVTRETITVVPVPGAFELPLAAMALAKTRRFSCVVALGCVIRGETPHFDFVAGEAASGLQLAAIETGVPVSFGLLTCETKAQAEARVGKGAEAARAALEMADLFTQVRTRAARTG